MSQPFDACVCRARYFKIDPNTDTISFKRAFSSRTGFPYLGLPELLNLSLLTPGSSLSFKTSIVNQYKFSEDFNIVTGEDVRFSFALLLTRVRFSSNNIDFLYNSGFTGSSFLSDDLHITSPQRTLRIISFLRLNYASLLPIKYYAFFDFSQLVASSVLVDILIFFPIFSLSPLSHYISSEFVYHAFSSFLFSLICHAQTSNPHQYLFMPMFFLANFLFYFI